MKKTPVNAQIGEQVLDVLSATKARYGDMSLRVYGTVAKFTNGSLTVSTDAGFNNQKANRQSDRSVKENIVRIGDHPLGIGIYLFDYKPQFQKVAGTGRQFGVMANEVKVVMPLAVSRHADGYRQVDYSMLGVQCA